MYWRRRQSCHLSWPPTGATALAVGETVLTATTELSPATVGTAGVAELALTIIR